MDKNDYDTKMRELLTHDVYPKLNKDQPTSKLIRNSTLPDNIKAELIPKNSVSPSLYGFHKIHKINASLRSTVNTINSSTY